MDRDSEILTCWKQVVVESDAKAFEKLYYLTNAKFVKFCRQYISDKSAAEDIVSDIFAYCWINRQKLQHVLKPEVFLLVSIKNKALNHSKQKTVMQLVPLDAEHEEFVDIYSLDEELERKELVMRLDKAIGSLPVQCRVVFKLVKEDGMKCAEVAEILNISVRTVHAQIYKAMKKLNSVLAKEAGGSHLIKTIASAVVLGFFCFFF